MLFRDGFSETNSRPDTTLAQRRGRAMGPILDAILLDHPIYGYTRSTEASFLNDCASRVTVIEDDEDDDMSQHDNDAKTPMPKDMGPVKSTSSGVFEATTPSVEDLDRRGLPSACVFVAK